MASAEGTVPGPRSAMPSPHLMPARRPVPGGDRRTPRPLRREADTWPLAGSVAEQAAGCGIRYDHDVERATAEYLAVPSLSLALPDSACEGLAAAWRNVVDKARPAPSPEVELVALIYLRAVLRDPSPALGRALEVRRLRPALTRLNVGIRLGGQLYAHARAVAPEWRSRRSSTVDRRWLDAAPADREPLAIHTFRAALAAWTVVTVPAQLSPTSQRLLYGMRGVTQFHLSSHEPDPVVLLTAARDDLLRAEDLGEASDRSPEHHDVLGRVYLELHDHDGSSDALDLARRARARAFALGYGTAELVSGHADVLLSAARRAKDAARTDDDLHDVPAPGSEQLALRAALCAFRMSALLYDRAHRLTDDPDRSPVFRAHRGRALAHESGIRRVLALPFVEVLDRAVADLRICAEPDGPYHGTGLTGALLARAQHAHRAKDYESAETDVGDALAYVAAFDDAAEEGHLLALSSLDVELQLRRSTHARDVAASRTGLRALLDLPAGARRTATPLTYAARLLLTVATANGLDTHDRRLIDEVVVELLAQADMPVTPAHVRYVCWHAATLLGLLRQQGVSDQEGRIHALLERARLCAPEPPSPVLVLHAARAAGVLARRRAADRSPDAAPLLDGAFTGYTALVEQLGLADERTAASDVIAAVDRMLHDLRPPDGERTERAADDAVGEDLLVDLQEDVARSLDSDEAEVGDVLLRIDRSALASRLAETQLRRAAFADGKPRCLDALRWFELAYRLGNRSAELLGLVGDALYRLDRPAGTRHQRLALAAKAAARAGGAAARENWSLCASISTRLWRAQRDPADHRDAVAAALAAHTADPAWPWPLLQLADLAVPPVPLDPLDPLPVAVPTNAWAELLTLVHVGSADTLRERAVELAVRSEEFTRARLTRSRTFTYVLDDPHDLLSASLVLKQTLRVDAERERAASIEFAAHLRDHGAPTWMAVPVPIAVIPWAGDDRSDVVYAMRRAAGTCLDEKLHQVVLSGRAPSALTHVERALALLARFHAWRDRGTTAVRALLEQLNRVARQLRLDDGRGLASTLRAAVPAGLPSLGYKDAHSGNWLVAVDGSVVALDMESAASRPAIFEVPRLVEDYPVVPVSTAGWAQRADLVGGYLTELNALGVDLGVDLDRAMVAYEVFAAVGAATSMELHTRPRRLANLSTDGRIVLDRRMEHWTAILDHVAAQGALPATTQLAARLGDVTAAVRNRLVR